jgi:hypothetical protein
VGSITSNIKIRFMFASHPGSAQIYTNLTEK